MLLINSSHLIHVHGVLVCLWYYPCKLLPVVQGFVVLRGVLWRCDVERRHHVAAGVKSFLLRLRKVICAAADTVEQKQKLVH